MVRKAGPVATAVAALAFAGAASAGEPVVLEGAQLDAVTAGVQTFSTLVLATQTAAVPANAFRFTTTVNAATSSTAAATTGQATVNANVLVLGTVVGVPGVPLGQAAVPLFQFIALGSTI